MSDSTLPAERAIAAGPAEAGRARYHDLDALRAFALLLGVVFHAAESFEPGISYWAIADNSPSLFLHWCRHACHSFRLEIFFLMAGFFARLVYHKRGGGPFVKNRLGRILVPLVVGWCLLYPVLVFLWIWGASVSGNWSALGVPEEFRQASPALITMGFFMTGQFIQKFDLTHLWFLHQLLWIYFFALIARALWLRTWWGAGHALEGADRWIGRFVLSPWRTLIFALPTLPMLWLMSNWGVDTPKESLWPYGPTTLLYGFIFTLGWMLHRQPVLFQSLPSGWLWHLLLGIALIAPSHYIASWAHSLGWMPEHIAWVRLVQLFAYALMMWSFIWGFTGLFVRFCSRPSAFWRYIADSSYWIYLVHLPVVVALQILVANLPLHWTVKVPLILIMAVPPLFLSYHFLVRPTFIGAQLNGKKYPHLQSLGP